MSVPSCCLITPVTNPRDPELPTPSARSLQEEVLFRQIDTGASEPAQAGGVQPLLPPHCPTQHPLLQESGDSEVMQGLCGAAWTAMQSAARATGTDKCFPE